MSTSSKSKTTTRKPPAKTATLARKKTTAAPVKTKVAQPATVETKQLPLRKKELIDAVVRRSGIKKKDAKPVVEALLAELGESLAAGRELALPPLGRAKINREKDLPNGRVIVMKLRQRDKLTAETPIVTAAE